MALPDTPADEFDCDAVQMPVLADIPWRGSQRNAMLWANRNGFFYVLDRKTGECLQATPLAKQNWNAGFDAKGRPLRAANATPSRDGVLIYPGNQGATNWFNPSFSPRSSTNYPGRGIAAGMRAAQRPNLRTEEENYGTVERSIPRRENGDGNTR